MKYFKMTGEVLNTLLCMSRISSVMPLAISGVLLPCQTKHLLLSHETNGFTIVTVCTQLPIVFY